MINIAISLLTIIFSSSALGEGFDEYWMVYIVWHDMTTFPLDEPVKNVEHCTNYKL